MHVYIAGRRAKLYDQTKIPQAEELAGDVCGEEEQSAVRCAGDVHRDHYPGGLGHGSLTFKRILSDLDLQPGIPTFNVATDLTPALEGREKVDEYSGMKGLADNLFYMGPTRYSMGMQAVCDDSGVLHRER